MELLLESLFSICIVLGTIFIFVSQHCFNKPDDTKKRRNCKKYIHLFIEGMIILQALFELNLINRFHT